MPHEKIYTVRATDDTDLYALVEWSEDGKWLDIAVNSTKQKQKEPRRVNCAPPFSKVQYAEMHRVIDEAYSRAKKYGYWVADLLCRALNSEGEFDIRYQYDLALEVIYNTSDLEDQETLIHRRLRFVKLNRQCANKLIKALRRGSRAVFGKDEW